MTEKEFKELEPGDIVEIGMSPTPLFLPRGSKFKVLGKYKESTDIPSFHEIEVMVIHIGEGYSGSMYKMKEPFGLLFLPNTMPYLIRNHSLPNLNRLELIDY